MTTLTPLFDAAKARPDVLASYQCTVPDRRPSRLDGEPKLTRVYLAGPMTGIKDLNFPAFNRAAASLRASGYEVINPVEINSNTAAKWEDCMRDDIAQLVTCDKIALLPGYENSRGARLEKYIADALGMRPIFVNIGVGYEPPPPARCAKCEE